MAQIDNTTIVGKLWLNGNSFLPPKICILIQNSATVYCICCGTTILAGENAFGGDAMGGVSTATLESHIRWSNEDLSFCTLN